MRILVLGGVVAVRHLERVLRRRPNVEITLVSREHFFVIVSMPRYGIPVDVIRSGEEDMAVTVRHMNREWVSNAQRADVTLLCSCADSFTCGVPIVRTRS